MARKNVVDRSARFLPIVLKAQPVAGSFNHASGVLVDAEIHCTRPAESRDVGPGEGQ